MATKIGRNAPRQLRKGPRPKIEPARRLNIFVGDTVEVVDGRYDLGKQGTVLKIIPEKQQVIVKGIREVRWRLRMRVLHCPALCNFRA